jgi:hypothetical protein
MSFFCIALTPHTNSACAEQFFADDFESGTIGNVINSTPTIGESGSTWGKPQTMGSDSVSISDSIAHSGSKSLRFHYSGVSDGSDNWVEQRFHFAAQHKHVFMRFYIYFPDGNETWGENKYYHRDSSGTDNNKFWRMWALDYKAGSVHTGYMFYPLDGGVSKIKEKHYSEGTESEYSTHDAGWYINDDALGRWICFEFETKLNTPGELDGITRMWVDNILIHEKTDCNYSSLGETSTNFIQNGYLMGWSNSGFTTDTNIYIDDIVFSDSHIGPTASADEPAVPDNGEVAQAPKNLRVVDP